MIGSLAVDLPVDASVDLPVAPPVEPPDDPPDERTVGLTVGLRTAAALRRLRLVSVPEAVSWLLLLVASVLKRTTDVDPVPVLGPVHGGLFILYVLCWLAAWRRAGWSRGLAAWYLALSLLPTGGFFAERRLRRESAARRPVDPAEGGVTPA